MIRQARQFLLAFVLTAAGCASHNSSAPATKAPAPTTQPADAKSNLPLDQITPVPQFSSSTTQPTTRPSLDALVFYAKAHDAMAEGHRFTAISSLEKAIELDPTSYQLRFALGKAYLAAATFDERAIYSFEQAAALEPDHLDLQVELGRQYLIKNDLTHGIQHLRLALQTTDYADDDGQAAVADFLLARALKEAGYDRAALDQYDILLTRLKDPTLAIRQNQELAFLLSRPELLYLQIGEIYERNHGYAQALQAYQPAADRDPGNFDLQSRVARMLASLGRRDEALSKASALVVSSNASPDSLELLRNVCTRLNLQGGEIAALTQLHHDHPADRSVLTALIDALVRQNRSSEAEQMLAAAWDQSPGDVQITRRLVFMYAQRNAVDEAARILVLSLARQPDSLHNFAPLWSQLLRPGQKNRLRLQTLQSMRFAPDVEPAREFWISQIAELQQRDALAHSALQQSTKFQPPFAPAYRALLNQTWNQDDLSQQQKIDASNQLADSALAGGNVSLAIELHGLSLFNQKKPAAAMLSQAIEQGGKSPDLLLADAVAIRSLGKDPKFEELMWKLINEHPLFDPGYAVLFRYYTDSEVGSLDQAMKVMSTWLMADPQSVSARVIAASVDSQTGQIQHAERSFTELFSEDPDNPEILEGVRSFYARSGRVDDFISKLEEYRSKHLQDTVVVATLVSTYADQKRTAEAGRILDATRTAVADDPDLLYAVAQLYGRIDQKTTAEEVLQQVVHLDPSHAGASNDLGYQWADEGKNLASAESLIRVAVTAEPDNQSFLDSLGWVLYKRGKFDEARKYLDLAVGPAAFPDPVVLDHLGDTLYRLSLSADAAREWQRSLKGIGEGEPDRIDLRQLRLQLLQKLKESEAHTPVEVAPVVESGTAAQAKN
jgi:predicted Zn-dependent protease